MRRLRERLLRILAATIPLYVVGVEVAGYELSLPVLILILLDVLILVRGRFVKTTLAGLVLFVSWCVLTAAWRHPVASWAFSLAALTVVVLPLVVNWPELERGKLFRAFLVGLMISLAAAGYEVAVSLVGLTPLEELVGYGLITESRTQELLGFRRLKALMMEPAHYGIYLGFSYAIVDAAGTRFLRPLWRVLVKGLLVLTLAGTLSLAGVLLLLAYLSARALSGLARRRWARTAVRRTAVLVPVLSLAVWGLSRSEAAEAAALFVERGVRTVEVIRSGVLTGSEGSRANALPILLTYWSSGGRSRLLWGEGYANHEAWLVQEYGDLGEWSSFARGEINNVVAAVGLATGVLGLALYFLFCALAAWQPAYRLPAALVALWFVANLASGMLVGYLIWSLVLMARLMVGGPRVAGLGLR